MASKSEKLFRELANEMNQSAIQQEVASDLKDYLDKANIGGTSVTANKASVEVVIKAMQAKVRSQGGQFIDLKPYFAASPKAKQKKNGGWYMIIPIGAKARTLKANAPRSLWETFSHADFGTTMSIPNLQKALGNDQSNVIRELQYTWKSNNVTRVAPKSGKGIRGKYITFRTVSDKSDPASWIVGRQNAQKDDPELGEKLQKVVGEAINKKVQTFKTEQLELL